MKPARSFCLPLLGSLFALAAPAAASDKHFGYVTESAVLNPGDSELEPWTTARVGHERYYSVLDGRLEFEHGLAQGLQLALYWNFTTETQDTIVDPATATLGRVTSSELSSLSAELKYKLTDPVADALGSALYLETTFGPDAAELEGKLIADRQLGSWLFAGNLVGEYALHFLRDQDKSKVEGELELTPLVGAGYFFAPRFSVGLELRSPIELEDGEIKTATLFGGPVLAWSDEGFWAALAAEPQLVAFKGAASGQSRDLVNHEKLELRLLMGFHL